MGIFDFFNNKKKEKARQEQLRLQEEEKRRAEEQRRLAERRKQEEQQWMFWVSAYTWRWVYLDCNKWRYRTTTVCPQTNACSKILKYRDFAKGILCLCANTFWMARDRFVGLWLFHNLAEWHNSKMHSLVLP